MNAPAVSLVIPTYNRCELLRTTLPVLLAQKTEDFEYEVIFTSNGSTDGTREFLEAAARGEPRVRFFHIDPTGGPSAPRNNGIRHACGEVVVILDDDVVPHEDFVLAHWRFHQRHPEMYHAALGEVYVPRALLGDPMSLFHTFPYEEIRNLSRLSYVHFWTCNVSVKRKFMLECGMFDEYMLYFEDILVGYRLAQCGMHLHLLPEARGQHLHKLHPSGVAEKGRFTGRWLFEFVKRLPEPEVLHRFGIFSRQVPFPWLTKKMLNRVMFRTVDNGLTRLVLRCLGADNGIRSRWSDAYYYLIFRRNMLLGYSERKREWRTVPEDEAWNIP